MKVKIKRFDTDLPVPQYKTKGAACVDLYARETITIHPHEIGYIPLNIAIQVPANYWVLVTARSSTHKLGIMQVNGVGIGDQDFSGNEDEYQFAALNFTQKEVKIEKGTRIAQLMVLKNERIEFSEVETLNDTNRGGFGTTGTK